MLQRPERLVVMSIRWLNHRDITLVEPSVRQSRCDGDSGRATAHNDDLVMNCLRHRTQLLRKIFDDDEYSHQENGDREHSLQHGSRKPVSHRLPHSQPDESTRREQSRDAERDGLADPELRNKSRCTDQ